MVETIVGILGAAFIGIVGWVIKLGSRVSVTEVYQGGLKEVIEARFDNVDNQFENVDQRLSRIERSMNGHLYRDQR